MIWLSIFVSTCRPANIVELMRNLQATANDKNAFELLINIDTGDNETYAAVEAMRESVSFSYRILETPKDEGYYSLHHGYNALLPLMSSSTYFCWLINDELRLERSGWDEILKSHIHHYEDDVFRLKPSVNRLRNYTHLSECFAHPDNYAIFTRAWIEATGSWSEIWGPDSWHQAIDYHLAYCRNPYLSTKGIFRSLPVEIGLGSEEAGRGLNVTQSAQRKRRIKRLYRELLSLAWRQEFLRRAQLLNIRIFQHYYRKAHMDGRECEARELPSAREFVLYAPHTGERVAHFSYDIVKLTARNTVRKAKHGSSLPVLASNAKFLARWCLGKLLGK